MPNKSVVRLELSQQFDFAFEPAIPNNKSDIATVKDVDDKARHIIIDNVVLRFAEVPRDGGKARQWF